MKTVISQKLIESGEWEKLRELVKTRLTECGWRDQLKAHFKEIIQKRRVEHVTFDEIVKELTKNRAMVPDSVKRELLQRIRTSLAQLNLTEPIAVDKKDIAEALWLTVDGPIPIAF
uniref:Transcription and mRNA export factor ENY2 n=1 Tax=Strigamia maritima TaxID=126957 RepID=T1JP52_STRMM